MKHDRKGAVGATVGAPFTLLFLVAPRCFNRTCFEVSVPGSNKEGNQLQQWQKKMQKQCWKKDFEQFGLSQLGQSIPTIGVSRLDLCCIIVSLRRARNKEREETKGRRKERKGIQYYYYHRTVFWSGGSLQFCVRTRNSKDTEGQVVFGLAGRLKL